MKSIVSTTLLAAAIATTTLDAQNENCDLSLDYWVDDSNLYFVGTMEDKLTNSGVKDNLGQLWMVTPELSADAKTKIQAGGDVEATWLDGVNFVYSPQSGSETILTKC